MSELHPLDELVGRRPQDHEHLPTRRVRRKRKRRGRRFLALFVALLLVAVGVFAAFTALKPLYRSLTAGNDYSGSGSGSVTVQINPGQSGRSIGSTLQKDGVVKSASAFADAAAGDPAAAGIQPGTYTLRLKMSAASALSLLLDPSSRITDRIVVREGLRADGDDRVAGQADRAAAERVPGGAEEPRGPRCPGLGTRQGGGPAVARDVLLRAEDDCGATALDRWCI